MGHDDSGKPTIGNIANYLRLCGKEESAAVVEAGPARIDVPEFRDAIIRLGNTIERMGTAYKALETAALAAAEAIERLEFGGTGGYKYAKAIRDSLILEPPDEQEEER
jgi:hypothetical protein